MREIGRKGMLHRGILGVIREHYPVCVCVCVGTGGGGGRKRRFIRGRRKVRKRRWMSIEKA